MKTTVEKLTATRVKLNISVTPEELQPSIQHAYEHIGSQVNIPGFRRGHVGPPFEEGGRHIESDRGWRIATWSQGQRHGGRRLPGQDRDRVFELRA